MNTGQVKILRLSEEIVTHLDQVDANEQHTTSQSMWLVTEQTFKIMSLCCIWASVSERVRVEGVRDKTITEAIEWSRSCNEGLCRRQPV